MKRESKFRGKQETWEYGGYYKDSDGDCYIVNETGSYKVDPDSVGEYTGIRSENGKGDEIYEGMTVYLAGYGNYEVEWPFTELYEAAAEGDIGKILNHG